MDPNNLAKQYGALSSEERFRLIVAAGTRGDDVEQRRLMTAGKRITLSFQDHSPFAQAFGEVADVYYLELLEEAHRYEDAWDRAEQARQAESDPGDDDEGEDSDLESQLPVVEVDVEPSIADRYFDLMLAAGFSLHTKAAGWQLFCERLSVPPFAMWEYLPGFDRLKRSLELAEKAAFVPEGFVRWLNSIAPAGEPPVEAVPVTPEDIADGLEEAFRTRVKWWGGD